MFLQEKECGQSASPRIPLDGWSVQPGTVDLLPDEVHVWRCALDLPGQEILRMERTLASEERGKASRFHFDRDRNTYTATRGILRALLGGYLGEPPERVRFLYGPYGKPALPPEPGEEQIRFNVSHSSAIALFAFARSREVGIDLEEIRTQPDLEEISKRFFSAEEVVALRALPARAREKAFFSCWTGKEAYIKGLGEGLSMPLDRFAVSLDPPEGPIRLRIPYASKATPAWRLHRFEPYQGYIAALAVECEGFHLRFCGWSPDGRTC